MEDSLETAEDIFAYRNMIREEAQMKYNWDFEKVNLISTKFVLL